jgi:hypothetical protein
MLSEVRVPLRDERKSKHPENAPSAMPIQGILFHVSPLFIDGSTQSSHLASLK